VGSFHGHQRAFFVAASGPFFMALDTGGRPNRDGHSRDNLEQPGLVGGADADWKKTTTVDPDTRTEHVRNHRQDRDGTRDFTSQVPGTWFCGDITYLRTVLKPTPRNRCIIRSLLARC
jgi:hypothetical protein